MSKIRKPHELNVQTKIKALIYGQPGLGKTSFALSAPNPVLLDFDNGVHRVNPEHQTDTLQVETWQDVLDVVNDGSLASYQTIVIDTAGKMLDAMSLYLISKNPKLGKANGALTLQGYGERKMEFTNFIKKIAGYNKHIIFVAHEKEEKVGDNKEVRPEVGGSSGTDLYKELDLIGYMESIGNKRTISFAPTEKYYAKNSCGLTQVIDVPLLSAGVANNFFEKEIIGTYQKNLEDRKEKIAAYNELIEVINAKVDSIVDAETANDVIEWAKSFQGHIWSSKMIASKSISDKCKELNLQLNPKTKKYEDAVTA